MVPLRCESLIPSTPPRLLLLPLLDALRAVPLAVARVLKSISGAAYVNATDKMFLPALILLGVRWILQKSIGPGTMYAVYGYNLLICVIKEQ